MSSLATHVERLQAAHVRRREAEDSLRAIIAKRSDLELELERERASRQALIEQRDRTSAERILKGVGRTGVRTDRYAVGLTRADETIGGILAALPMLEAGIEKARAAVADCEPGLVAETLRLIEAMQAPSLTRVKDILAQLADPLAELMAADVVRAEFIGDRFTLPAGCNVPPAGGVAALKFIDALPTRFRPDALTKQRVTASAHKVAAWTLKEAKGETT